MLWALEVSVLPYGKGERGAWDDQGLNVLMASKGLPALSLPVHPTTERRGLFSVSIVSIASGKITHCFGIRENWDPTEA